MSEFFHEAFRRARGRYSAEQWLALAPAQITDAIYREMRQMDAENPPAASPPLAASRRRGRRDGAADSPDFPPE